MEKNINTSSSALIKWITIISSCEYLVWGIVDPIYSLFVNSIVGNYFLVGIIFGIRSLTGMLALFFFAKMLKRIPLIQGFFLSYILVFIGFIGFFLSGILESIILLCFVAALNGMAFMLKQSSKQNMLMNEITSQTASKIMGGNIAIKYTFWSIGMLIVGGIFSFVDNISLPHLYLAISGFWVFLFFFFSSKSHEFISLPWKKFWRDTKEVIVKDKICLGIFSEMKSFSLELNYSIVLCFFMEITSRVSLLFVPLLAQSLGLNLSQICLLTAFMVMPMIFTFVFSSIADKYDRLTLIIYGIAFSLFPLLFLTSTDSPIEVAIASSVISLCIALLQPSVLGLSGNLAPKSKKHTVIDLELFFTGFGSIVGAVGLGAIAEYASIQTAFLTVAIIAFTFLCTALWLHFYLSKKEKSPHNNKKTVFRKIIEFSHFGIQRHFR